MKKLLPLSLLLTGISSSFAQLNVVSNGALISVSSDKVIIDGNFIHQNNDTIVNTGDIYLTGNWTNNNSSSMVFTDGPDGWVHLSGAADQTIDGSKITHFNNLELTGSGIKKLSGIDTHVEDVLALNDREFSAGDKTVFVLDNVTGAVTRTSTMTGGFVSATNDGGLSRNTLSAGTYLFPVGSSKDTVRYRPVELAPNSASANTYKVRMANVNATTEGFDISKKENSLNIYEINPSFYHRIARTNGSSAADVTIYYDETADGAYKTITHWQGTPQWEDTKNNKANTGTPLSSLTKAAWNSFSPTPFALAKVDGLCVHWLPNIFSPNSDGQNDDFKLLGRNLDYMSLSIFDRWGGKVFETTNVNTAWDGTHQGNGKLLNTGVYVYILKGKCANAQEEFEQHGNVTIVK